MREVTIRLESIPVAWARPGEGPFGRYDTQKRIKKLLGAIVLSQLKKHTALTGCVECTASFILPLPKSQKTKEGQFHSKKPDLDNLLKFYLDLCKDCRVYKDDCQICSIMALKRYVTTSEDDSVGVRISFQEVSPVIEDRVEELNGKLASQPGGIGVNKIV